MHPGMSSKPKGSFLERSVNWLTMASAAIITFFATPSIVRASAPSVTQFARDNYGFDFGVGVVWALLCCACVALTANLILKLIFSGSTMSFFKRLMS